MAKTIGVILASGIGSRTGFDKPKQMVKLAGRPVVAHTLERFQSHPLIDEIAIVTNEACVYELEALVSREGLSKVTRVLIGGAERYESSLAAIRSYDAEGDDTMKLLFHDAVRPLVSHKIITDVVQALDHYKAVDTAVASADTVIFADPMSNIIREIPDRRRVRLGQTPQGFHLGVIKAAYAKALLDPQFVTTDDCNVVLRYAPDEAIYVVDGDVTNLKLTYREDLMVLDKFMQSSAGRRLDAPAESLFLSQLAGRVLVVCGGTSGIGASMVRLARAYGAEVIVMARSTGDDIANAHALDAKFQRIADDHGRIDAVINAAAILNRRPLISMSFEDISESINTNILGAINLAKVSYDHLTKTQGHLLFFASSSYTYGRAFYSTYSSSKAAIVNLTQALADEWAGSGIKVNCVNPERARTPMRTKAFGAEDPATLLDPDEVARKALSVLVSKSSGYIYDVTKVDNGNGKAASAA